MVNSPGMPSWLWAYSVSAHLLLLTVYCLLLLYNRGKLDPIDARILRLDSPD